MKIGYARVSTRDQRLDIQIDKLKADGCELIYSENISGKNRNRPELEKMLAHIRKGDVVTVCKLDRLGRSTLDLMNLVKEIEDAGADFRSLSDSIDTSTSHGRLFFAMFAAVAEFERETIQERCREGIAAAKERGVKFGRPEGRSDRTMAEAAVARQMKKDGKGPSQISRVIGRSRMTVYRYLNDPGYAGAA